MPVSSSGSYIVLRIDEVDVAKRIAYGVDKTNSAVQAFFMNQPGNMVTIPAQGEHWTAIKIGNYWHLDQKRNSTAEQADISGLQPGDSYVGGYGQTDGWGSDYWGSAPWGSPASTLYFGNSRLSFNGVNSVGQQVITGSKTDGTALNSLITALTKLGLTIDDTSD